MNTYPMTEEEQPSRTEDEQPELIYELKSVKEAAELLRVSESTVWRYADRDLLPSFRVGPKRVMFRRSDLESLLGRVRKKKGSMADNRGLRLLPMTEGGRSGTDAILRAKELRERILAGRDGVPVRASWMEINEAREERAADL